MSKHETTIIERAEILYSMGRCDQAVNILTQAIETGSVGHEAHAKLAELLIDSERYGDALKVLQEAESDPFDIDCYLFERHLSRSARRYSVREEIG